MKKNIAIVSTEKHLLIREIIDFLSQKSIHVEVIPLSDASFLLSENGVRSSLESYDLVYLDRGMEDWQHFESQFLALDSCENLREKIVNKPISYLKAHDKITSSILMRSAGLPMVTTHICYSIESALKFALLHGAVISKPPMGFNGDGIIVFKGENPPIDRLSKQLLENGSLYLQKFLHSKQPRDLRIQMIDGEVAAYFERHLNSNVEFPICNIDQGARPEFVAPDKNAVLLAKKAMQVLDLQIGGVDLLFGPNDELVVSEVNPESTTASWMPQFGFKLSEYLAKRIE